MSTWRIIEGDCRDVLRALPAQSVHTCVTSPPYFGLRDYGTGEWEGGDPACGHKQSNWDRGAPGNGRAMTDELARTTPFRETCGKCGARRVDRQIGLEPTPDEFVAALVVVFREVRRVLRDDGTVWLNLGDSYSGPPVGSFNGGGFKDKSAQTGGRDLTGHAQAGQANRHKLPGIKSKDLLGVPWMVAFALRADGWFLRSDIIWSKPNPMPESVTDRPTKAHEYVFLLSKGPRYFYDADAIREDATRGYGAPGGGLYHEQVGNGHSGLNTFAVVDGGRNKRSVWTVATQPFSGWTETVRRVCVEADDADDDTTRIASPDCPVHGSPDRPGPRVGRDGHAAGDPSRSHDNGAGPARAQQPGSAPTDPRHEPSTPDGSSGSTGQPCAPAATPHSSESRRTDPAPATSPACTPSAGTTRRTGGTSASPEPGEPHGNTPASSSAMADSPARPSARTPDHTSHSASCTCEYYREITEKTSHFATFPPKLIEPCILAGASERACGECGGPWVRVVEREEVHTRERVRNVGGRTDGLTRAAGPGEGFYAEHRTIGFEPSCSHGDGSASGVVLDPFAGAGTTGMVALRHNRSFIGVELNPVYADMARWRIRDDAPLLNGAAETTT